MGDLQEYLIYIGVLIAGAVVRHYFPMLAGLGGAVSPPNVQPPSPLTPLVPILGPGRISIGNGELLSLLLAALKAPPPAGLTPSADVAQPATDANQPARP